MNLGIIKGIVGLIGGMGASTVVKHIIDATTPEDISKITKASVSVGSFVIGGAVAMSGRKYTDQLIDEVGDLVGLVKKDEVSEEE